MGEAYAYLLVGDAKSVEVGVFVIPLDGQVAALVKQRKSRVHGLRGYVKGLCGFLQLIHRGDVCAEMLQLADEVGGRARGKPAVGQLSVEKCVQQTEGVVYTRRVFREVVQA